MNDADGYDHNQPTAGWQQALDDPTSVVLYLDEAHRVPLILRPIPPTRGRFWMGSNDPAFQDDVSSGAAPFPVTNVAINEPYWMGAFPVTQLQWRVVVEQESSSKRTCSAELYSNMAPACWSWDYWPVIQVTWTECFDWLEKLGTLPWIQSQLASLSDQVGHSSLRFQLPTELHWEWSCRAVPEQKITTEGSLTYRTGRTEFHAGDGERALLECGWFANNSGMRPHRVGELQPNALGLYDLHGNVWELCSNQFPENYDRFWHSITPALSRAFDERVKRTTRGGSWFQSYRACRSVFRGDDSYGDKTLDIGFRICLFPQLFTPVPSLDTSNLNPDQLNDPKPVV